MNECRYLVQITLSTPKSLNAIANLNRLEFLAEESNFVLNHFTNLLAISSLSIKGIFVIVPKLTNSIALSGYSGMNLSDSKFM